MERKPDIMIWKQQWGRGRHSPSLPTLRNKDAREAVFRGAAKSSKEMKGAESNLFVDHRWAIPEGMVGGRGEKGEVEPSEGKCRAVEGDNRHS